MARNVFRVGAAARNRLRANMFRRSRRRALIDADALASTARRALASTLATASTATARAYMHRHAYARIGVSVPR
jgi:hypothetical protein